MKVEHPRAARVIRNTRKKNKNLGGKGASEIGKLGKHLEKTRKTNKLTGLMKKIGEKGQFGRKQDLKRRQLGNHRGKIQEDKKN